MNKILNNRAITLVEILIAITVFSVVMIIVTSMIIQSFNIINSSSETVSTKQLAEIMLDDITNNLRIIKSVVREENNLWEFNFQENYDDNKIKLEITNNTLKIKIDGKVVRVLDNVQNTDIVEIVKDGTGNPTGKIIVNLNVEDETGRTINKRKIILARNQDL